MHITIYFLIACMIVLGSVACLAVWPISSKENDSVLTELERQIRVIGEAACRELDQAADDYRWKLREFTRR